MHILSRLKARSQKELCFRMEDFNLVDETNVLVLGIPRALPFCFLKALIRKLVDGTRASKRFKKAIEDYSNA